MKIENINIYKYYNKDSFENHLIVEDGINEYLDVIINDMDFSFNFDIIKGKYLVIQDKNGKVLDIIEVKTINDITNEIKKYLKL